MDRAIRIGVTSATPFVGSSLEGAVDLILVVRFVAPASYKRLGGPRPAVDVMPVKLTSGVRLCLKGVQLGMHTVQVDTSRCTTCVALGHKTWLK